MGEWIGLGIAGAGLIITILGSLATLFFKMGATDQKVKSNADDILKLRREAREELDKLREELIRCVDDVEASIERMRTEYRACITGLEAKVDKVLTMLGKLSERTVRIETKVGARDVPDDGS